MWRSPGRGSGVPVAAGVGVELTVAAGHVPPHVRIPAACGRQRLRWTPAHAAPGPSSAEARPPELTSDLAGAVQRGPCLLSWRVPPHQSHLEAPGGCAQARPWAPPSTWYCRSSRTPQKWGTVLTVTERLWATLTAKQSKSTWSWAGRGVSRDLGPPPTHPGQASSSWHSWTPGSGSRGSGAPRPWPWVAEPQDRL